MATRELTEADLGETLKLSVGDELVLALHERPGTGYRWAIQEIDKAVLGAGEGVHQLKGEAPGSARARRLRFTALAPGSTSLRLKRSRGDAVDRELTLAIAVEP